MDKAKIDKLVSLVARGKVRKRKYLLLEASSKYLGVVKPKKRF